MRAPTHPSSIVAPGPQCKGREWARVTDGAVGGGAFAQRACSPGVDTVSAHGGLSDRYRAGRDGVNW
jgi:hypothetical protein